MTGDAFVVKANPDETVDICTKPCWICGQHSYVNVPAEVWRSYDSFDVHLDTAWPDGSEASKQLIRTGVHLACWNAEFPEDD